MADCFSSTAKIVEEVKERQDEFIFSTIYPFCESVTEMRISKKELTDALLLWKNLVRCKNCKYCDNGTDEDTEKDKAACELYEENKKLRIRAWGAESDLLTYSSRISQLETENAKLKAERDAAVSDLKDEADYYGDLCFFCKKTQNKHYERCNKCVWEWRGVKEEEKCD